MFYLQFSHRSYFILIFYCLGSFAACVFGYKFTDDFTSISDKVQNIYLRGGGTVLVYLLLLVCWLFSGGDWLLSIAYPMVTLGLLIVWLGIVVIRCLPINGFFKSGILVLILGWVTAFVNPVIDVILDASRLFSFYFSQRFIDNPWNLFAAGCLAGIAVVWIASGVIWRSSKKK